MGDDKQEAYAVPELARAVERFEAEGDHVEVDPEVDGGESARAAGRRLLEIGEEAEAAAVEEVKRMVVSGFGDVIRPHIDEEGTAAEWLEPLLRLGVGVGMTALVVGALWERERNKAASGGGPDGR